MLEAQGSICDQGGMYYELGSVDCYGDDVFVVISSAIENGLDLVRDEGRDDGRLVCVCVCVCVCTCVCFT